MGLVIAFERVEWAVLRRNAGRGRGLRLVFVFERVQLNVLSQNDCTGGGLPRCVQCVQVQHSLNVRCCNCTQQSLSPSLSDCVPAGAASPLAAQSGQQAAHTGRSAPRSSRAAARAPPAPQTQPQPCKRGGSVEGVRRVWGLGEFGGGGTGAIRTIATPFYVPLAIAAGLQARGWAA